MSLDQKVGTQVTIDGTARNAMAGAVVLLADRTPVYVDGVESWDDATDGKKISASGTLRKRGIEPPVRPALREGRPRQQREQQDRRGDPDNATAQCTHTGTSERREPWLRRQSSASHDHSTWSSSVPSPVLSARRSTPSATGIPIMERSKGPQLRTRSEVPGLSRCASASRTRPWPNPRSMKRQNM